MTLTPMVADTATASATIATPVRDSPDAMPATAMRPGVPPMTLANGAVSIDAARTNRGTHSAKPTISRNTAARPATRLVPEMSTSTAAATIVASPVKVTAGRAWRVLRSSAERVSASRGA